MDQPISLENLNFIFMVTRGYKTMMQCFPNNIQGIEMTKKAHDLLFSSNQNIHAKSKHYNRLSYYIPTNTMNDITWTISPNILPTKTISIITTKLNCATKAIFIFNTTIQYILSITLYHYHHIFVLFNTQNRRIEASSIAT